MSTTTTTRRQSRAARGAQAAQSGATVVPIGGAQATGSRAPAAVGKPSEAPKPQPPVKPSATGDVGARQVTYWFPSLALADGTVIACPHARYGHESEKSAKACLWALAAKHGVTLG